MKYYIITDTKTLCLDRGDNHPIHIKISHPQPQLKRTRVDGVLEDPLEAAQDYLNALPLETQEAFYTAVSEVHGQRYLYTKPMTMDQVITYHRESIEGMLKATGISLHSIHQWVVDNIPVPASIEGVYDRKLARVNGHSRAQTYISTEYQQLLGLGVMVKLLAPWSIIFSGIEASMWKGNTKIPQDKLNEYIVFKVYPRSLVESDAFKKLSSFVERRKTMNSLPGYKVVDSFISDESIIGHIVSSLISRLLTTPIKRMAGNKNIVATLYSTLEGHFKPERKKEIRLKVTTTTDASGELDKSISETYKDRSKYFIHEQVILLHTAKFENALKLFKPLVVMSEVRELYKQLLSKDLVFTRIQEALCANTLRWVISPDIYGLLTYEQLKGLLAITSHLLKGNHKELSLLCISGVVTEEVNGEMVPKRTGVLTDTGSRFLPTIDTYPIRKVARKVSDSGITITIKDNVVIDYIRRYAVETPFTWIPINSNPYYSDVMVDGKLRPMPDIQILLANWLTDLDNIGNVSDAVLEEAVEGRMTFD